MRHTLIGKISFVHGKFYRKPLHGAAGTSFPCPSIRRKPNVPFVLDMPKDAATHDVHGGLAKDGGLKL